MGVKSLLLAYDASSSAWMIGNLFNSCLKEWVTELRSQQTHPAPARQLFHTFAKCRGNRGGCEGGGCVGGGGGGGGMEAEEVVEEDAEEVEEG